MYQEVLEGGTAHCDAILRQHLLRPSTAPVSGYRNTLCSCAASSPLCTMEPIAFDITRQ
ncbi:hypothetical protein DAEQUDRAFT_720636 [Daedalea quercina L-15889]|uniref:Uncharacterized protein n=1 Tax=Daedalea quercina L-15889 TaxID=1314783 RepID=A0A165U6H1_9APHY|nr:hypothetical protein DAEQUDRAFT_720636 [Daedalea quercina L-15889]